MARSYERTLLRMAEGWRPLAIQVEWRAMERAGLVRLAYGPDDSPDRDKLCLYLTDKGRETARAALAKATGNDCG